jgi:chemotaxis protein methyltransferase CheR
MTLSAADFHYISTLVRTDSAIVLEPGKEYLVQSRLLPLARQAGQATVGELVAELRRSPRGQLRDRVVEAMTTNETSFFRDKSPFDALAESVLPELLVTRRQERALDIWCAACSSGQEPYSIAMLVLDALAGQPGWRPRILATDLSPEMLERTRRGAYSQLEVNRGLPAPRLVRHFRRQGADWVIEEPLRRMVETRPLNLAGTWPAMPPMDLVFLRNVLIYFDLATKRQILAQRVRCCVRAATWCSATQRPR